MVLYGASIYPFSMYFTEKDQETEKGENKKKTNKNKKYKLLHPYQKERQAI